MADVGQTEVSAEQSGRFETAHDDEFNRILTCMKVISKNASD
jgi:hypothetical protein